MGGIFNRYYYLILTLLMSLTLRYHPSYPTRMYFIQQQNCYTPLSSPLRLEAGGIAINPARSCTCFPQGFRRDFSEGYSISDR